MNNLKTFLLDFPPIVYKVTPNTPLSKILMQILCRPPNLRSFNINKTNYTTILLKEVKFKFSYNYLLTNNIYEVLDIKFIFNTDALLLRYANLISCMNNQDYLLKKDFLYLTFILECSDNWRAWRVLSILHHGINIDNEINRKILSYHLNKLDLSLDSGLQNKNYRVVMLGFSPEQIKNIKIPTEVLHAWKNNI
jgi:hypothetical protein